MDDQKGFRTGLLCGIGVTAFVVLLLLLTGKFVGILTNKTAGGKQEAAQDGRLHVTDEKTAAKMKEIEDLVNQYYLNDVDPENAQRYLYSGMLFGLDDPYAAYYTKEEYDSMMDSSSGSYCGIGAVFSQNIYTGQITVTKVYEGYPALEAGMQPGDVLYAVDGEPVGGEELTKVVSRIKGEEGTWIPLTMLRGEDAEEIELKVERRPIEVPTVEYEMLADNIGYIAVSQFDVVTSSQFEQALSDLEDNGMQGLIIDLRDNGGGVVKAVTEMADLLLPEGLIVYTEDRSGKRSESFSDAEHVFEKPLAVLMNKNSASSSEIFAGAIQDYGAGKIVGTQSFGKGIVQMPFTLSDGTAIKLTISKYYTPNGNNIHGVGITPDVEVELPEEVQNKPVITKEEDSQLQKAIETVKKDMGK